MVDILGDVKKGRVRPANYIQICRNLADSYPFIYHGVQKDAIQNAMDARKGRSPLHVEFNLFKNEKGMFFTITDTNTCGLTGPILAAEEFTEDLPEDYHWARFESFAFTKSSPDALGARGQGKFIFLNASQEYTMFYDTLRDDGIYRLGATRATETGCPIFPGDTERPWENAIGDRTLFEKLGVTRLTNVGTRVIIVNPIEEIARSVTDGSFANAIYETWHRALQKNRLTVTLVAWGDRKEVSLPKIYDFPTMDSKNIRTWILGKDFRKDKIMLSDGTIFKVKNFYAMFRKEFVYPEELQGIAIVQNGMKICSLNSRYLPFDIAEHVTGHIEFDRKLDRELRRGKNQEPTHYNLKWRSSVSRAIKEYIESALAEFGRIKLGIGLDPRKEKRQSQRSAEEWAIRQLQKLAKDLDLFGAKGTTLPHPSHVPTHKTIGISIENFHFPDPDSAPRINWDQSFDDLVMRCFNNNNEGRIIGAVLAVLWADSELCRISEIGPLELRPGTNVSSHAVSLRVERSIFNEPGEYRLKARMYDPHTGERVDEQTRRFWVEKDPPFKSAFNLEGVPNFPGQYAKRQWLAEGSINNSPIIFYNTSHPTYRQAENDEFDQREYLLQICVEGALHFVLERPPGKDGLADYHPLEAQNILGRQSEVEIEDVPAKTYEEVTRYMSEFRWRLAEAE